MDRAELENIVRQELSPDDADKILAAFDALEKKNAALVKVMMK